MKGTARLLLLSLAVAGCQTYWTKPGFNQADWNRDRYECERDMRQSGYYGGGIVGAINAQDFFEECLVARGYYKVRESRSASTQNYGNSGMFKGVDPNDPCHGFKDCDERPSPQN